jgi:hypothetical protein
VWWREVRAAFLRYRRNPSGATLVPEGGLVVEAVHQPQRGTCRPCPHQCPLRVGECLRSRHLSGWFISRATETSAA